MTYKREFCIMCQKPLPYGRGRGYCNDCHKEVKIAKKNTNATAKSTAKVRSNDDL